MQKSSDSTIFTSVKEGFTIFICLLVSRRLKFLYKVDLGMDKATAVDLTGLLSKRGIMVASFTSISLFLSSICFFCKLTFIKLLPSSVNLFAHFHNLRIIFLFPLKEFAMAVIAPLFSFPLSNCARRAYRISCISAGIQSLLEDLVSLHCRNEVL